MNERFAAEPTTCDSSIELKHLFEKFGPATGRYLAAYPDLGWERRVLEHIAEWKQLEQEKAKVLLRRAKERCSLVYARGVAYQDEEAWVRNVERTQASAARFDGVVVSRANAGAFPSLDEFDLPPTSAGPVEAKCGEYARVSRTLLMASPELHLIDAYLDPCDTLRKIVLQAMLGVAAGGRCKSVHIWVREDRLKRSLVETKQELIRIARRAGFTGARQLDLHCFTDAGRDTKVHDRYLLSLHGAIRFEHGFQELTGARTANVAPESRSNHEHLVSQFLESKHDLLVETIAIDVSSL